MDAHTQCSSMMFQSPCLKSWQSSKELGHPLHDQIPYQVFKRCPSLTHALLSLFQCCWSTSTIPTSWKLAGIKLIGKSSALDDPREPSNFRPIALTSCVGKLFTTILKNRWLEFMLSNKYLDRSVQKPFMTATPGCLEHQSKMASIIQDARSEQVSNSVLVGPCQCIQHCPSLTHWLLLQSLSCTNRTSIDGASLL